MEVPVRGRLPHEVPAWVAEGSFFLITVNCEPPGENQLCRADTGEAVLTAAAFNHDRGIWYCRLMLLMPDHLHAIIAFPRDPGMRRVSANWKRFLAGRVGIRWQRDFFDHRLRDHHEATKKDSYILHNPVRKGLARDGERWPWIYRPGDRLPPRS